MSIGDQRVLGRTGLRVGRLGLSSGYGAPAEAMEEAFERGCNYFYWGSFRREGLARAVRNICSRGKRDDLIVVIPCFTRLASHMEYSYAGALKRLGLHYGDVLLLGWYNSRPPQRIIDRALRMKEYGLCKYIALSGHNRKLFGELAKEGIFDLFHIRYNAVHSGAEQDTFPFLGEIKEDKRPGVVTYTATCWGRLMNPNKMPPGEKTPTPSDCYRFVLSHPSVDMCLVGAKNAGELRENLKVLDRGAMTEEELGWMRRVGGHLYGGGKG
ncbi:MAG: hypothetical protein V3W31_01045 [Thermodesulfobacteriota bacterium]